MNKETVHHILQTAFLNIQVELNTVFFNSYFSSSNYKVSKQNTTLNKCSQEHD